MAIDPIANFVRGQLTSSVSNSTNTFPVGDASAFPDPSTDGEYNLVVFDAATYERPSADPAVEIVRVTARDTSADELTVTRAQENTTAEPHPDTTVLHQAVTASVISQIDDQKLGDGEDFDGQGDSELKNLKSVGVNTREIANLGVEAGLSVAQTISDTTFETVVWDSVIADDTNDLDTSTGVYTAPFDGDYDVFVLLAWDEGFADDDRITIEVEFGSITRRVFDQETFSGLQAPNIPISVKKKNVSAGDNISVSVFQNSDGSADLSTVSKLVVSHDG